MCSSSAVQTTRNILDWARGEETDKAHDIMVLLKPRGVFITGHNHNERVYKYDIICSPG